MSQLYVGKISGIPIYLHLWSIIPLMLLIATINGTYEFWGSRYVDVRMEPEVESITLEYLEGESGQVTDPEILKSVEAQLMDYRDKIETYLAETNNYSDRENAFDEY